MTTTPTVQYYDLVGATWTTLTHVRSYSYTSGRRDEITGASAGQATFVFDNADSTIVGVGTNLLPKMTPIRVMVNGNTQPRWSGWVDGSPVTFPSPEGTSSFVTVTASDSLALMQRHVCQTSLYEETLAQAALTGTASGAFAPTGCGYWPLSDPAGSATAFEASGAGTFSALATTGASTFGSSGVTATQTTAATLSATATATGSGSVANGVTLGFWVLVPSLGNVPLISATLNFGTSGFVQISNSGTSTAPHFLSSDGGSGGLGFGSGPVGGWNVGWNYVHGAMSASGTLTLYVNGVLQNSLTPTTWAPSSTAIGSFQISSTGPICHAWVGLGFNTGGATLITTASNSAGVLFLVSTNLLGTLARWAYPSQGFGANSFDLQHNGTLPPAAGITFTGNDCLTLAQVSVDSEDGPLFCTRGGVIANLTHDTLTDRASQTATAAFVNGDVESDLTFARDAQYLVTNCQITALSGSGGVLTATKNLTKLGTYAFQKSLYVTDAQATDFATWKTVHYGDIDYSRIGQFTIDLLNSVDIQTAALAIDIGSRVTFSGLPSQGGYTTADVIVQGFTEDWTIDGWRISFNTTPSASYQSWILEDATYGLLDQTTILSY